MEGATGSRPPPPDEPVRSPGPDEYRGFHFPLNVYSHVLWLDYGDVRYLHYGVFEPGQTDVTAAQERASQMLLARLPSPPCRVLEVGIGLGTTLSRLVRSGYEVVGIAPDEPQIQGARRRHGDGLPVVNAALEGFSDGQGFDLLLFQESAQYIATDALFDKATELLRGAGTILIMDEVALRPGPAGEPSLPLLDGYLRMAEQSGFVVEEQLDLSALVAPTNDYILDAVTRHRGRLAEDLGLELGQLDALLESARAYCRKYRDGQYGYCLLRFRRDPARPAWQAGWARPEDEEELLALFQRAFGQEMPRALWRWKYHGPTPAGAVTRRAGRIVAFYGGTPRPVSLFGAPATAVHIGDVMVDPKARGAATRRGPYYLAASHFLGELVGRGKTFPLGFGFSASRVFRLGERLGLQVSAGEMMRVEWPALPSRRGLWLRTRPLRRGQEAAVDRLWREMAAALSGEIVGVRDFAFVRRRYLEHPVFTYRVFLVSRRLLSGPFGVVVVREVDGELELVDVVAPPDRVPALVTIVRRLARMLGQPRAHTWVTAQHAALFAGDAGTVSPMHIQIPVLTWPQAMPPAELEGRWWLMPGDTDFR